LEPVPPWQLGISKFQALRNGDGAWGGCELREKPPADASARFSMCDALTREAAEDGRSEELNSGSCEAADDGWCDEYTSWLGMSHTMDARGFELTECASKVSD